MAKPGRHERQQWPLAVLGVFVVTGFLFVAASVNADGADYRPAGGDIASLLQERSQHIAQQRTSARDLREDIDSLSSNVSGTALKTFLAKVKDLQEPTGLTALEGPGVRITLDDAPRTADDPDVDPNWLVVHQQDIQAYVNALWAGGAEAISLQGQRLISTSGIKCVGNVVVLDGVPYSPPYVIRAVGDSIDMNASVESSPETISYASYAKKYKLGLKVESVDNLKINAYAGPVSLRYAKPTS
jgi:uncharacterized protein YlxW (UPF0749 family)